MEKFAKGLAAILSVIIVVLISLIKLALLYGLVAFSVMVGLDKAFGLNANFYGLFILVAVYYAFIRESSDK